MTNSSGVPVSEDTKKRNYNSVAWFYQWLAHVYSCGQIRASKFSQLDEINQEDKVLYAGVGSGEDAVEAAKKGASVTCIDLSQNMILNTENEFKRYDLNGEFICGDIMEHQKTGYYDVVAANYFLNVFPEDNMKRLIKHLSTLVKPGGKLLIADFAIAEGEGIQKVVQNINYWVAIIFYWLLRLEPIHPIYDYTVHLRENGMVIDNIRRFRIFKIGPYGYQSIVSVKPE